jgi:hypothetical protein
LSDRVVILRWGGSAYDALGGMLDLAGQELTEAGYRVDLVSIDQPQWHDQLRDILTRDGGAAFGLTMSGVGTQLTVDGKLLWEQVQVPLFNWNCDHPCYFVSRHLIDSRYLLHGYVFPDHARYNIDYLNPTGVAYVAHLAMPPRRVFANAPLPLARRNGRLLFLKSGQDTNAIEARWRLTVPLCRDILFEAAETLFHATTADFAPAIRAIGERHGVVLHPSNAIANDLIQEVDTYVRFKRANLVTRAVLAYPVDVHGVGWDSFPWEGAKARYLGPATWDASMASLPSYVGALSMNPLVDLSVHDRVFHAIAAGVAPCSDSNAFSRAELPALEPYAFRFTPESVAQAVDALLSDPQAALDATEATYQALQPRYTLRQSVLHIAQAVLLHSENWRWTR